MYVNKIANRITFEKKTANNENGEYVPHLETTEVVLIHCIIVNNDYQQDSRVMYTFVRVMYTFVPNKAFSQLLDISHEDFIFSRIFNGFLIKILNQ